MTHDSIQIPISIVGPYSCYNSVCGLFTPSGRGARRGIENRDYHWGAIATGWQTLNRSRICPTKSSIGRTLVPPSSQPKYSTVDFPAPPAPAIPNRYSFVRNTRNNSTRWDRDFLTLCSAWPISGYEARATPSGMVYTSLAQVFGSCLIVSNFPLPGVSSRLRWFILSIWGKMCRKKQKYI